MNVARSAAEVLDEHTTLELECIDRMYLNVYVPVLQTGAGASYFFRQIRGNPMPSSALMAPMTRRLVSVNYFCRSRITEWWTTRSIAAAVVIGSWKIWSHLENTRLEVIATQRRS